MKIFPFVLFFALVLGCASTVRDVVSPPAEILPPQYHLSEDKDIESRDFYLNEKIMQAHKYLDKEKKQKALWWLNYKRASLWIKLRPEFSCRNFKNLSQDKKFPLYKIALIRAHQVCSNFQVDIQREKETENRFQELNSEPWLSDYVLDLEIKKSEQSKDNENLVELYWQKSKLPLRKSKKVLYTKKALRLAKKNKDTESTQKLQKRLYRFAPRLRPLPKRSMYMSVALDYRRHRQFNKSRYYYIKILNSKKSSFRDKLHAFKGVRRAHKLELNTEEYIKSTENMARFVSNTYKRSKRKARFQKAYHDTYFTLARTYWTKNKIKKAKSVLKHLARKFKGKISLAKVYWMEGRLKEEGQKYLEAHWWFEKSIQEFDNTVAKTFQESIYWLQAWNLYKAEQYQRSAEKLQKLVNVTESQFDKSRYSFWLAKSFENLSEKNKASEVYADLIKEDNVGYYGLMAQKELNGSLVIHRNHRGLANIDSKSLEKYYNTVNQNKIEWLISLGENQLSKRYLDQISKEMQKQKVTDEKVWMSIFQYYARAHEYLGLFEQLGRLSHKMRQSILQKNPELIFPKPYQRFVTEASQKYGVSSEFIYSIMRQESAFNPMARSHADAFGLMQVLPQTAFKAAKKARIRFSQAEDLFKPRVNIPIGSSFLRTLYDQYDGRLILAIASYNASEKAIDGWMKTRFNGNSLEFIEDIPYSETRGYVRLVLRNILFYKVLNAQDNKIEFPSWILKLEDGHSV